MSLGKIQNSIFDLWSYKLNDTAKPTNPAGFYGACQHGPQKDNAQKALQWEWGNIPFAK